MSYVPKGGWPVGRAVVFHSLTPAEHARRYSLLKQAQAQVQRLRGENDKLGVCSLWGPTPRSGATWSNLENAELILMFRDKIPESGAKLNATAIAELAWELGRSANAVNEQLRKLLRGEYYKHVEL